MPEKQEQKKRWNEIAEILGLDPELEPEPEQDPEPETSAQKPVLDQKKEISTEEEPQEDQSPETESEDLPDPSAFKKGKTKKGKSFAKPKGSQEDSDNISGESPDLPESDPMPSPFVHEEILPEGLPDPSFKNDGGPDIVDEKSSAEQESAIEPVAPVVDEPFIPGDVFIDSTSISIVDPGIGLETESEEEEPRKPKRKNRRSKRPSKKSKKSKKEETADTGDADSLVKEDLKEDSEKAEEESSRKKSSRSRKKSRKKRSKAKEKETKMNESDQEKREDGISEEEIFAERADRASSDFDLEEDFKDEPDQAVKSEDQDEEDDDTDMFSDLNIPSWEEIISSLYRPDK